MGCLERGAGRRGLEECIKNMVVNQLLSKFHSLEVAIKFTSIDKTPGLILTVGKAGQSAVEAMLM